MVKKGLLCAFVLAGVVAAPRPAMALMAGCGSDLLDCYTRAANIDSFWYRTAAGLDCELDYADCVRQRLVGA
jgi:hypothetical protein